jgi:hypothetical protein
MTRKSLGYALAAGLAVFLTVGVAVTELAGTWVEFSLFVGLPAGIVAGAAAAAAVTVGLSDGAVYRNAPGVVYRNAPGVVPTRPT